MSEGSPASIAFWAARWRLTPDGAPIRTRSSRLLPVRTGDGELAMLKVAVEPEESAGAALMAWWDGQGAARVFEHEDNALLLERATGPASLLEMARDGRDEAATGVLCATVSRLHIQRADPSPASLVPLGRWFAGLAPAAERHGGLLSRCAETAKDLLADPIEIRPLHGDIHHGNVLDFGTRGWLAVDPKGLIGERGFDYANILCNPDRETALAPGRLAWRASFVAEAAGLDRTRLLNWVLAWAGLSAVWMVEDGSADSLDLSVAEAAASELDR